MQPEVIAAVVSDLAPEIRRRHAGNLIAISRRFDVDDLVQTVALRAHRGAESCRAESVDELRHWVLTIAERSVLTAVAREVGARKRSLKLEVEVTVLLATGMDRDVSESLIESEQAALELAIVNRQLSNLPPRQALAVRLRYLEQLDYSEISDRMNVTAQAVRSLVSKGLAALRELSV